MSIVVEVVDASSVKINKGNTTQKKGKVTVEPQARVGTRAKITVKTTNVVNHGGA